MRNGRNRWRRVVVAVIGLAAAALAGWVLYDNSDELVTAADTLKSVRPGWVVVAVLIEVFSYLARGAATAVVLRRGGGGVGTLTLSAAVLAGDAAAYCLPLGFAASGVVMFGILRRRQVSAAVAGWMFAVASVFYVSAVTAMTIVAVPIAGNDDVIPGLQTLSVVLLGVLAAGGGLGYTLLRRPALRSRLARLLPRVGPGRGRWDGVAQRVVAPLKSWLAQLRTVRLTPFTVVSAFGLMIVSWVADVAVLAVAFIALGSSPPWTGLLLAYCAGQIAASVPITPGGIGVMEGSITLALVYFGGAKVITLTAVLLYRLIAYWGCIPAGGLAWLALRAASRVPADHAAAVPNEPVRTEVAEAEPLS
ncbi:MAG TPA: lysylphosphatidylglycerol synthase transmembrane domain-containing protein [Pseudonocardiaceae bacterium]|nr:lysylphosphatidylglycerol synthase transmembrane domain-containing protein [Pseudonocardiaceae bacterium]